MANHLLFSRLLVPFLLIHSTVATKIDNDVIGEPQVSCTEDSVTFSVRTQRRFAGNIFIKGKYNIPQCRQEYFSNSFTGASFTVRIGDCGMRRIRQLQPHGMNYVLVFVVNFHNQFITKVDRAYNVRCFYAQIDKTVTSQLGVSMLGTTELSAQTLVMPNCVYTVRSGTLNGPEVRFVRVGDRLVHRWQCDNPNFGMLVKNCFVNDGQGSSVRVLDSRGCPVFTPVVQGTLNYDNSLNLAYVDVWAYKFPDRSQLFFQCQIQVCNKRENECVGVTPPNCPLITGGGNVGGLIGQPNTIIGQPNTVINPNPNAGYIGSGSVGIPNVNPNIGVNQIYPGGVGVGVGSNYNYGSAGVNQYRVGPYRRPENALVQGEAPAQSANLEQARPALGDTAFPVAGAAGSHRVPATIEEQPAIIQDQLDPLGLERGDNFIPNARPGPISPVRSKSRRSLADVETNDFTMDVASETVFVADVENEPEAEEEAEAFAQIMNHEGGRSLVCLSPISMGCLISTFMMMLLVIATLLVVIYRRTRGEKFLGLNPFSKMRDIAT